MKKVMPVRSKPKIQEWKAVPLKGSFMVLALLGFFISAFLITDSAWRLAFLLVFTAMFVASIISMTKADIIPDR
ncbi:MAG TPA: hypothetical protein VJH68_00060 [Candidatus Nanoarchaeia archaeon]|nr:hypothetical protein [Candidatus Nanoarchaeia archaeon]